MKIKELIEVLQILVVYCKAGTDLAVYCESGDKYVSLSYNKTIMGPRSFSKIGKAHLLRLEELGWRFDEKEECWRKFT